VHCGGYAVVDGGDSMNKFFTAVMIIVAAVVLAGAILLMKALGIGV
jgi:hypothetical protein